MHSCFFVRTLHVSRAALARQLGDTAAAERELREI
jgi:hypothetical protein